jgi:hypothetical protein
MNQLIVPWARRASPFWVIAPVVLWSGCLSPKTIEPVARQNEENIAHYTANVAKVTAALIQEDAILRQVMLQQAQERMAEAFVPLRQSILVTDATATDVSRTWVVAVQTNANDLKALLADVSDEPARAALAAQYPLVYDIAAETPGFSAQRVIKDSLDLDALNGRINNAATPEIARVYLLKRAQLLSAYAPVQRQSRLNETYRQALEEFVVTLDRQAGIAGSHAKAFVGYSQARPAFDSLVGVAQNADLRQSVLALVAKNKGQAASDELKANLGKADQLIGLFGAK